MYFLPEDEVNLCEVSFKLENNIKLMRKIDTPRLPRQNKLLVKHGRELILLLMDTENRNTSYLKFDYNGVVCQNKSVQLPNSEFLFHYVEVMEELTRAVVGHELEGKTKYKLCFFDVFGNTSHRILVKDIVFDVGSKYGGDCEVFVKSKYIATFFNLRIRLQNLLILFEIQLVGDDNYECVGISRIELREYIDLLDLEVFHLNDMVLNETEEKMVFQVYKIFSGTSVLLLYDIKTRTIQDKLVAFEGSNQFEVYFVDHIDFKGGVIVAVSYNNEVRMFTQNYEKNYVIFKSFSFKYEEEVYVRICVSNRGNQLLLFHVKHRNVAVYDLFDTTNNTLLPIPTDARILKLCFNKTGEEIYVLTDFAIDIYLYKSVFKSLVLHCASVVKKTYTKSQLIEMRLPKHLYKYL